MSISNQECKNPLVYQEVNSLICEYLELNGLEKTVTAFASECRAKALPCPFSPADQESKASFSHYDAEKMLKSFDEGDQEGFFRMWRIFQVHIQSATSDMQKLEVYLRVHFALWPKAHREPEPLQMQSMAQLKTFFEEQASKLSNDTSVLPLFALPYVSEPESHPIFRDLFHADWTSKLRVQLEITIRRYFDLLERNISDHSKLVSLVMRSHDGSSYAPENSSVFTSRNYSNESVVATANSDYYKDRFFQLVETYRRIRKLLKGTRDSYGKLLKVSNELITALEQSVNGHTVALDSTLQRCNLIFPEIFTPMDSTNRKPDMEYFKSLATGPSFDKMLDSDVSLFFLGISDMNPDCINYPKIKTVLSSDEVSYADKLVLLQAIRWLLTKTTSRCRKDAMDAFIAKDLLGLSDKDIEYRTKIFAVMLSPNPTYLKECFSRLLNAFASTRAGRQYMAVTNYCLDVLVKALLNYKDESESFICQMIVATLQKLSLRKKMRLGMIDRKVIQWVIVQIKSDLAHQEKNSILKIGSRGKDGGEKKSDVNEQDIPENFSRFKFNPYLMEYSWALLMNLCLHDESMSSTSSIAPDILTCIIQTILNEPTKEVAPYVISTLYSILRNENIFELAKKMQLENVFADLLKKPDSEIAMHLNQVLAIIYVRGRDRLSASSEIDYDDDENVKITPDPDDFEAELELHESWSAVLDDKALVGDELLLRQYMSKSSRKDDIVLPRQPSPQKPGQQLQGILVRPTTPKTNTAEKTSPQARQNSPPKNNKVLKAQRTSSLESSDSDLKSHGKKRNSKKGTGAPDSSINDHPNAGLVSFGLPNVSEDLPMQTFGGILDKDNLITNGKKKSVRKLPSTTMQSSGTIVEDAEEGLENNDIEKQGGIGQVSFSEVPSRDFRSSSQEPSQQNSSTKTPKVKRMVKKSKKVRNN